VASEHLRKLWREAQQRRRAKLGMSALGGVGLSGPARKAHKPRADHPWVVDKKEAAIAKQERDPTAWFEETESLSDSIGREGLLRELGYFS
jgi:hypothetical protein